MVLDDLLYSPCEWLKGKGAENDIVMSSRIRLARNLSGFNFTHRLSGKDAPEVIRMIRRATEASSYFKDSLFLNLKDSTELDRQFLLERHLISREHAESEVERAICVSPNEIISIMILEEDHLRIQVLESGFNLTEAWRLISKIDSELEKNLPYAFDPNLGYLTACPTNVGTGLRASTMLHLPALVITRQINKVLQALSKLNLAVRGLYGEGTQASGNFFQFSNQITLGQKEEDIIDNLERVIRQIIEHEREARSAMKTKRNKKLEDEIWRSLGLLKSARLMTSREATSLLSLIRLGVDLDMIENLKRSDLNELLMLIHPAHLQKISRQELSTQERDVKRAELIRSKLKDVKIN